MHLPRFEGVISKSLFCKVGKSIERVENGACLLMDLRPHFEDISKPSSGIACKDDLFGIILKRLKEIGREPVG